MFGKRHTFCKMTGRMVLTTQGGLFMRRPCPRWDFAPCSFQRLQEDYLFSRGVRDTMTEHDPETAGGLPATPPYD